MNSGSKENYDTIGLEDDTIVMGAQKINLNENRDENFKSIAPVETKEETEKKTTENIKEESSDMNILSKVKGFFKFGSSDDSSKNNNTADAEVPVTNTEENSCKQKLLKKLQDNIEIEKSYQTFFILLVLGLGLLCISLMFLPVIILSPYKFVLCFSFGSLLILVSFIFIYGTKSYFETLFSKSRFIYTLLFLGSIFIGISFAWSGYFLLSLLCSFLQLVSLIVFTLSFIPGGKNGISYIRSLFTSPFANMWMRFRGGSYLPS